MTKRDIGPASDSGKNDRALEKLPLEIALEEALWNEQQMLASEASENVSLSERESRPAVPNAEPAEAFEPSPSAGKTDESGQRARSFADKRASEPAPEETAAPVHEAEAETDLSDYAEIRTEQDNPPPEYLRSTPPQQSRATFLPRPEPSERDGSLSEPINSSNNETMAGLARADRASSKAFSQAPRATRSGRAARSAGLDMTEQYKARGKFRRQLAGARIQHPYIMDRPLEITDQDARELIEKIRRVPLYHLPDISREINAEESKRLFHALLLINDSETYSAIQQLAMQRAGWALYTIGWSTLQRNFPNRRVQQTLELVYNTLVSDPSRAEIRPSYIRKAIGDLVNLGKSDEGLVIDVVRHLNQAYNVSPDEGLESFLEDYDILLETPFGGAVMADFFRRADLPVLFRKKEILCRALPYMHPAVAAEVVTRIISSREQNEDEKLYIYKQIAEIFLHREASHPMWNYMSTDMQRSYKTWYIRDRLENQTAMYPGKREFLQTYIDDIEDVAMISSDIMAIRFDRFILIDDRRRGDSCLYYDNETVRKLLLQGLDEKDLANPNLGSRNAEDAVKKNMEQGVVRLGFAQGALPFSRRFMDRLLGHGGRHRENILRNWFR